MSGGLNATWRRFMILHSQPASLCGVLPIPDKIGLIGMSGLCF